MSFVTTQPEMFVRSDRRTLRGIGATMAAHNAAAAPTPA